MRATQRSRVYTLPRHQVVRGTETVNCGHEMRHSSDLVSARDVVARLTGLFEQIFESKPQYIDAGVQVHQSSCL